MSGERLKLRTEFRAPARYFSRQGAPPSALRRLRAAHPRPKTDAVLGAPRIRLLVIHLAMRGVRHGAVRHRELREMAASGPVPSTHARRPRRVTLTIRVPSPPAVRLADVLTSVTGWALLASWLLIALAHRHVAGATLIGAGALQTLALILLIPDAMASHGWLSREE